MKHAGGGKHKKLLFAWSTVLLTTVGLALAQTQGNAPAEPPAQVESLNGQPRVFSRATIPPSAETKEVAAPKPAPTQVGPPAASLTTPEPQHQIAGEPTAAQLQEIAVRAWAYFQSTQSKETGLNDSVAGYHHATMWDIASNLAALVAAEKLGIISRDDFRIRTERIFDSLRRMPLYNHELPNREYDIVSLGMLDNHSQPSLHGSGWSATDLGRLLIWLKIVEKWYPELGERTRGIIGRYKFNRLVRNGEAYGALLAGNREFLRQEGRLGYEQYAASGFELWGLKLDKALQFSSSEAFRLYNVQLRRDTRNVAYLTSEPFFLGRIEIGTINLQFDRLEQALYEVQSKRWETEGILTAVSEDAISQEPWFVYNTVSAGKHPWTCVSPSGQPYPQFKSVSTKAAVALWSVHADSYGLRLLRAVDNLYRPTRGYYAGVFEDGNRNNSLNLNTNAIILEAILFRRLGSRPFLRVAQAELPSATNSPSGRNPGRTE